MAARPRETAHIAQLMETADEKATRTYNLLISAMADGHICDVEYTEILAAAQETTAHTDEAAERSAMYDATIEYAQSLIHNGASPRSSRLGARLGLVSAAD